MIEITNGDKKTNDDKKSNLLLFVIHSEHATIRLNDAAPIFRRVPNRLNYKEMTKKVSMSNNALS